MRLPTPRGPVSAGLLDVLTAAAPGAAEPPPAGASVEVLSDGDVQLSLALAYELHYRGLDGVAEEWEWDPGLLRWRADVESRVLGALREAVMLPVTPAVPVDVALTALVDGDDGPSLSSYLMREATAEQFRDFVRQRSVYQLKEADPHTWVIPRIGGAAKAALVEIQTDEYGGGRGEARMHCSLFAKTMRGLGLDDTYGAYWDDASAQMLATVNVASMFGLHRRWRGAAAGHLAALEMTSTTPNRRYGNGLRRLGFDADVRHFYDEHVEADAVHEQLAAVDLCGSLVRAEPSLRADVLFGAACCLALESRFAAALLQAWGAQEEAAVAEDQVA